MAVPYGYTPPQATTPGAPDNPTPGSPPPQRPWGGFIHNLLNRLGSQWPQWQSQLPTGDDWMQRWAQRYNVRRDREDGGDWDGTIRGQPMSQAAYQASFANNPIAQASLPPAVANRFAGQPVQQPNVGQFGYYTGLDPQVAQWLQQIFERRA